MYFCYINYQYRINLKKKCNKLLMNESFIDFSHFHINPNLLRFKTLINFLFFIV